MFKLTLSKKDANFLDIFYLKSNEIVNSFFVSLTKNDLKIQV